MNHMSVISRIFNKLKKKLFRGLRRVEAEDFFTLLFFWLLALALASAIVPTIFGGFKWAIYFAVTLIVAYLWATYSYRFRKKFPSNLEWLWKFARRILGFGIHNIVEPILESSFDSMKVSPTPTIKFPLKLTYPGTFQDKYQANRLAKRIWGSNTTNLFTEYEWHLKNPNTLAIIHDSNNSPIAYFDFCPVEPSFLKQIKAGRLDEYDLVEHLIEGNASGSNLRSAKSIYVAGLMRRAEIENDVDRSIVGAFTSYGLVEVITKAVFGDVAPDRKVHLLTVAFGDDDSNGARLSRMASLTKRGVVRVDGDPRKELHGWYAGDFTRLECEKVSRQLGAALRKYHKGLKVIDASTATQIIFVLEKS